MLKDKFQLYILKLLYPLLFVCMLLQTIGYIPPKGLPGEGIYIWPFRIIMAYMGITSFISNKRKCTPLTIYFVYSLLSIVLFTFNGYPIKLYFFDIAFYIVPMLWAYVGMKYTDEYDKFLLYTYWAIIAAFVIGLYLYIVTPSWYKEAMEINYNSKWYKAGVNADFDYLVQNIRFSSFFMSSYAVQYYGLLSLPMSLYYLLISKKKSLTLCFYVNTLLTLCVIILSMQRAAIASSMLILFIFIYYDRKHKKKLRLLFFTLIAVVFIVGTYFATTDLGERILARFSQINVKDTFSEARTSQNKDLLEVWDNFILGNGLGTGGNEARKMGFPAVTDSNYVKILVEQGVIGMFLFLSLIIKTIRRLTRNFKYLAAEGMFVVSVFIAMIGSNSLMFSLYIPPFWFAIGRIWNNENLTYKKYNNLNLF